MTEIRDTPTPDTHDDTPVPLHRIPMSAGEAWRYSLGDDGCRRGVYTRGQGKTATWHRVAPLPYVTARLSDRDGDGRRNGVRYRLTMDMDAASGAAAICDTREVAQGDWAPKLDVPLSADRKIRDATASAIYEIAHRPGVLQGEAVPTWQGGELIMPPSDLCPEGYMDYAADEDRALQGWRDLAEVIAESPRLGLAVGAGFAGLYVGPLERQAFLVEVAGGARSGKSTALVLAGATLGWSGSPRVPKGVVRSASSSAQGMPQMLRGLSVLPAFADETGTAKKTAAQKEEFILTVAQGASRTLGTRSGNGGTRTAGWSGVYLASGNESLAEGVANEGAWARVLSIPTPVTSTPAAAKRVAELLPVVYGWPLQWLIRRGMDLDGMAARIVQAEHDLPLADGGVAETLGEHVSLAVAGVRLLGELIGVDFSAPVLEEGRALVASLVADLEERGATPADRLMSAVMAAWATHPDTFPDVATYRAAFTKTPLPNESYPPKMPPVVDGLVLTEPPAVAVFPSRLGPIARESEITDTGHGLKGLLAEGRMLANHGRQQKVAITRTKKAGMYVFLVPDDEGQAATADGGPAGDTTPDTSGTSPDTRTEDGGPADEVPTDGQTALVLGEATPADEAPAAVPTGGVPSSHDGVPSRVPNGNPTDGNSSESAVTCENTDPDEASSQSSQFSEGTLYRGTPEAGNSGVPIGNSGTAPVGTRGVGRARARSLPTPPPTLGTGRALALAVTPDDIYVAGPGETITTEEPGNLVNHLGRLLDWAASVLPPGGGTIAIDADAADLLGWPFDMERKEDRARPMVDRPRCVEEAAAHKWTTGHVGGWTTWEKGKRQTDEFCTITVACLPWMDQRALKTSANILLDADDDAATAVYLLGRVAHLVGVPFAYSAGATWCMGLRSEYYDRHGMETATKKRRPMMRLNHDPDPDAVRKLGPVSPAFDIADGGMTWRRAGATDGDGHEVRHVMGLDAIGQHLGTQVSGLFGIDRLMPHEDAEWNPKVPGLWEIQAAPYTLDAHGPSLAPMAPRAGVFWAHTETVKLLIEFGQHSDSFRTRAWLPTNRTGEITRGTQLFRDWATRLKKAIKTIPRDTPDALEKRVRDALKAMYAEAAGELTKHPFVTRPDWSIGIWSGARAQVLRRAVKVWKQTGQWPIEINHDCLYYETDGIGPEYIPAPDVLKYDEKKTELGHVKIDFPDPDKGETGTMAEYIKKRGGEKPVKKSTRKSRTRKGGK